MKQLILLMTPALCLLAASATAATNMTPVTVTGFNRDVVIENTALGPPFTPYAKEFNQGDGTAYYEKGLHGSYTNGLPASGAFTNIADGTVFQLQQYNVANVVDITNNLTGTLSLSAPARYSRIAVLANSGSGTASGVATVTLKFNDGTTFATNYYAPDWFSNNSSATYMVVLRGFDRINITNGAANGGSGGNPRFYQTTIPLYTLGASNKPLASLTFGMPASTKTTGIYALSGLPESQVLAPTVTNLPATGIDGANATLNGQVTRTGGEPPVVTLFYGTNNGGAIAANWSSSVPIGYQTGAFSQAVSSLTPGITYYFTVEAVNGVGTNWAAPSLSFTKPLVAVSTVTNLPASNVQGTFATLNGQVLSIGGQPPAVTLFYGGTDGQTNAAMWANSVSLGTQSGTFAQTITGLTPGSTYYYTAKAVNNAGTTWAAPSEFFTTALTNSPQPYTAVLTQHNDNNRSGDNLTETKLTVANVNTNSFGLLYSRPVDDQIYAQPLIMTNVSVLGHGSRNLLIVATVNDSIYAYDADDPTVTQPYWYDSFISPPSVVPPNNYDQDVIGVAGGNYVDFTGSYGIVGTPVIDPVSRTLYVVVRTKEISGGATSFVQRLHALNVATGAEQANSPVIISASYPGTGDGGTVINFDPLRQNQRPGLALANGYVYISWASHFDATPYHGWVIGYNVTNLQQSTVWNDSPNGFEAGIWMSGQAPNADSNGNVYVTVGNGTVDANGDYGESFLKLTPSNATMQVASYFIPYNWQYLNDNDLDLGDSGMLLIPGTTLGISGGKPGVLYLVDRDNMGQISSASADTNVVQTWNLISGEIHGAPVWWNSPNGSFMYIWPASSDLLRQYQFANGLFNTTPYSVGLTTGGSGSPGGILSVSANGTNAGTGIIWATVNTTSSANESTVPGTLHAFNAQNIANELWNSDMLPSRDALGNLAKFVPPTIANGKVYAATFSNRLNVYGLLSLPSLNIKVSGPNLFISWPSNALQNSALQCSTNMPPGNWVNVTNVPVMTNGGFLVTVPVTGTMPATFYRLAW